MLSVLRLVLPDIAEVDQGVQPLVHYEDHVSALAAVPAVRPSRRHILLTAEGHMAVPALAAPHIYLGSVCKHKRYLS